MSKDFNWQTDEHTHWEEGTGDDQPASRGARFVSWFDPRWRRWGSAVLLLVVVGLVIYSLINRQAEQVEDANAADILAAHALVRQAAQEKDFDLLAAMIADNGRNWDQMQLELLSINLFLDRRPLNLMVVPESESEQENAPKVTVSPDLQTAELVQRIPYQSGGGQRSETILLEQTFYYQRRDESWFLTPLPDDETFWGEKRTIDTDYLTIAYPRREEAFVGGYLADKLNALIGWTCEDNTIVCPPGLHIELQLERDPTSLWILNIDVIGLLQGPNPGRFQFFLPAPTMVGRPVDEVGREALYHGYANWLAAAMVYTFSEEPPGKQEVDSKLAEWGLELPPESLIALPMPQSISAPPIAFPEQDILMACSDSSTFMMLRYNPRDNRWSNELRDRETTYLTSQEQQFSGLLMVPLPDDSGVVVKTDQLDSIESDHNLVLWRNGEEELWLESEVTLRLLQETIQQQFDPGGRHIIVYDMGSSATSAEILPYAINVPSCLAGDCEIEDYHGFPYWSPDSSWAVVVEPVEQGNLILRNNQTGEETSLGIGFSPFWVDNETFYYLRTEGDPNAGFENTPNVQIVRATVDNLLDATPVVESAGIAAAITGEESTMMVSVQQVFVHPEKPDWLFIFAAINSSVTGRENYLLGYQRDTGDLAVLFEFEGNSLAYPLQVTPDGRYLSVPTLDVPAGESFTQILVNLVPLNAAEMTTGFPIETYEIPRDFTYDWSQDGKWFVIVNQGELQLIAPGQDYEHTLSHDVEGYCQAVWINPLGE